MESTLFVKAGAIGFFLARLGLEMLYWVTDSAVLHRVLGPDVWALSVGGAALGGVWAWLLASAGRSILPSKNGGGPSGWTDFLAVAQVPLAAASLFLNLPLTQVRFDVVNHSAQDSVVCVVAGSESECTGVLAPGQSGRLLVCPAGGEVDLEVHVGTSTTDRRQSVRVFCGLAGESLPVAIAQPHDLVLWYD